MCSMLKSGDGSLERPSAVVQNESRMQAMRKIVANQAVSFFKTSAVEVPNTDSPESPPKEAPKPELLLS